MGPGVGLPTLQGMHRGMPRGELADLLLRYRRVFVRRNHILVHSLTWTRPGTVWAIDFAQPPAPVDGVFTRLLAVRDLASGLQLLWLPVEAETADAAADALAALFAEHGPPLVLKSDNGSPFIADRVRALLAAHDVIHLLSPAYTPQYNGSVEAGNGSMKTRTHHQSARHDRPGEWTSDDAGAARLSANRTARPWGHAGPTPDEAWAGRRPTTPGERAAFADAIRSLEREAAPQNACTSDAAAASVNRIVVRRALVAHGFLCIRRRSIPLPIKSRKVTKIR
jgi:hypothetical protein